MANPQLNELFDWLKRNERNHIDIYDVDRRERIKKCASYEDLTAGGITLEQYFARLVEKGIRTVQIVQKKKNGSSWVPEGCGLGYNYSISTDAQNNVAASGRSESPAATQQPYQQPVSSGLGSPASYGLGFPEIMAMRSNADRYEETKEQNRQLLAKVERLEADNRKLETDCLTYKLGADSKPSAVDKLVEGIAANPAALASLVQSFKGGGAVPALNAPATPQQAQLSNVKQQVTAVIADPDLSDMDVELIYYVLVQIATKNKAFQKDYEQLLIKHNLINNGSDNSSDSI